MSHEELQALRDKVMQGVATRESAKYKPDLSRIGLHEGELDLTWEHVKPDISDGIKAVNVIRPMYERGYGVVFMWGTWGQAKTLIGKIVAATAHRDGKRGAYANLSTVLDDIRKAYDEKEYKMTELSRRMDWWVERDVLFLDEMDKSANTEWAEDRMFQLLDRRYQMAVRETGLTVIASNKSEDGLDGYLKSRLYDRRVGQIVYLNGNDGRQIVPDKWKF
jgi:DNA replication protein DnaC